MSAAITIPVGHVANLIKTPDGRVGSNRRHVDVCGWKQSEWAIWVDLVGKEGGHKGHGRLTGWELVTNHDAATFERQPLGQRTNTAFLMKSSKANGRQ